MQIHRYFIEQSLENFNHLIYCPTRKIAMVVDPFSAASCNQQLQALQLTLTHIVLTHSHNDHIRGATELQQQHNALFIASRLNKKLAIDMPLDESGSFEFAGEQIHYLATPGHYADHVCYFQPNRWLMAGDTLFNAGIGHVRDGDIEQYFMSLPQLLALQSDDTQLYNGHNYLRNNCQFTLSVQPNNPTAQTLLNATLDLRPDDMPITTLKIEQQINLFMQALGNHEQLPAELGRNSKEKFIRLRQLRDQW